MKQPTYTELKREPSKYLFEGIPVSSVRLYFPYKKRKVSIVQFCIGNMQYNVWRDFNKAVFELNPNYIKPPLPKDYCHNYLGGPEPYIDSYGSKCWW